MPEQTYFSLTIVSTVFGIGFRFCHFNECIIGLDNRILWDAIYQIQIQFSDAVK